MGEQGIKQKNKKGKINKNISYDYDQEISTLRTDIRKKTKIIMLTLVTTNTDLTLQMCQGLSYTISLPTKELASRQSNPQIRVTDEETKVWTG